MPTRRYWTLRAFAEWPSLSAAHGHDPDAVPPGLVNELTAVLLLGERRRSEQIGRAVAAELAPLLVARTVQG